MFQGRTRQRNTLTIWTGYSWHTNQRGLTDDNVQVFELVKLNGIAINVTESSNPDLFFALKVRALLIMV